MRRMICEILSSEFYTFALLDKVIFIIRTRMFRQQTFHVGRLKVSILPTKYYV